MRNLEMTSYLVHLPISMIDQQAAHLVGHEILLGLHSPILRNGRAIIAKAWGREETCVSAYSIHAKTYLIMDFSYQLAKRILGVVACE